MKSITAGIVAVLLLTSSSARADFIVTATLSGTNQVPPNSSMARGTATLTFLTQSQTINYDVLFSGLTAPVTEAHVHYGPSGFNGPVILPFNLGTAGTSGELKGTLSAADLTNQGMSGISTFMDIVGAAQAGFLYVNVHDSNYPGGEIRGQLVPEPSSFALVGAGLVGLAGFAARKGHRRSA